jgi:cytochrome P450
MSEPEIVGATSVLVNAGGESTATCMAAAVYFMLKEPHVYEKAKTEVRKYYSTEDSITSTTSHNIPYLNAVIDEVFRFYAPTPGNFSRRTVKSARIDGHMIPPNVSLLVVMPPKAAVANYHFRLRLASTNSRPAAHRKTLANPSGFYRNAG